MMLYKELKELWWFRAFLLGIWAVTGGAITWHNYGHEYAIGIIAFGAASLALALVLFVKKTVAD